MKKSSIIIILWLCFYTGVVQAEQLTSSKFMKYSESQKYWWLGGTYTALGYVAFMNDEEKGKCVWDWYFSDHKKSQEVLMKTFEKYPDHPPTGVIIALLQKSCNVFPFKNK